MPRINTVQTNFTAGEISPQLYGRVDIAKYQNGAKRMLNALPQVHGGARRRFGTIFVREVKDSSKVTRLVPFVLNATTAYIIEMGDLYARYYKNNAVLGAPYEVVTPYASSQIFDVDYTHGEDTMFMFHEAVAPQRMIRAGDTSWTLGAAPFVQVPFEEPGIYPAATLTPSVKDPVGAVVTLTAGAPVFSAGNVGSSVKINGGIVFITAYTDGTHVDGLIKQELSSVTISPAPAWSLHAPAWSSGKGWPRSGTLYQQRLVVGGSPTFPQTLWGSVTGAYLDFQQGVADDDAFLFKIASDNTNPIRFLAGSTALVALTSGGEFTITGGLEKPLAPTNAQIKPRRNHGCANVRPVRVLDSEFFVQRAGRKVRALSDVDGLDKWGAPDVSLLSEHLTESGIVDMCWQQEPTSIVWMVRADGKLVSATYDADQDVNAWALHDVGGAVESVACIPTLQGDQVWMIVRRVVGGVTKRYIERMATETLADCSVVASGAASTVWGGLSHLEGQLVDVRADGHYAGRHTVTGGQVTLGYPASSVVMGLPFTCLIELLDPAVNAGTGSSKASAQRTAEVTILFHETTGAMVNGRVLDFRTTGPNTLDQPPALFSGVKRVSSLGWNRGASPVTISQEIAMPLYALSVTRKFTFNDG